MSDPVSIHFIEKAGNFSRADQNSRIHESCCWKLAEDTAASLTGGMAYFHKAQDEPSYFGGRVTGCRKVAEGDDKGRFVIIFEASMEAKGVRAGPEGWSNEKKIARGDE